MRLYVRIGSHLFVKSVKKDKGEVLEFLDGSVKVENTVKEM